MTTQPSALAALLPCPFCGGRAMLREESPFNVCCLECEADSLWSRDFTEAVAAWNKRAAWPTQAQGELAGWQYRYNDPVEGFGMWVNCREYDYEIFKRHERYETRLVYATNPSPSSAALREALSMLRECVEGEFGLQAWVDTYPCDHTPKLIERARTLLAGEK